MTPRDIEVALPFDEPLRDRCPTTAASRWVLWSRSTRYWLLALPALGTVLLFVLVPYLNIVAMSIRTPSATATYGPGFTLQNYARVLGDPLYLSLLADTLIYAAISTAICLGLGFPIALQLARTRSRWRGLLYAAVLSPLLTGVVIRCFGWIVLLSNNGLVNQLLGFVGLGPFHLMYNSLGVGIALVHVFLPFMILPIMNGLQAIDPKLREAALTLGASQRRAFLRVTLPLAMPGVQSGVILVFVLSASAYVIPMLMGGGQVNTTPTIVVQALMGNLLWPFGAALALVLSLAVLTLIGLFGMATRRTVRKVA
jgi:putative spermidine/putrescine transport system permease protein